VIFAPRNPCFLENTKDVGGKIRESMAGGSVEDRYTNAFVRRNAEVASDNIPTCPNAIGLWIKWVRIGQAISSIYSRRGSGQKKKDMPPKQIRLDV